MSGDKWADLRKPFPKEAVGKLPKGGTLLNYVGHAAVTDRLLTVDPEWTWEPLALDEHGLPALDKANNLWIKLTVLGVTRIGVGDGPTAKECIGDALRNAAMRFGVALELWSKEELESIHSHQEPSHRPADPEARLEPAVLARISGTPPPLAEAKARAWNVGRRLWPDAKPDELKRETEGALMGLGSSIATADTEKWNELAAVWETQLRNLGEQGD